MIKLMRLLNNIMINFKFIWNKFYNFIKKPKK